MAANLKGKSPATFDDDGCSRFLFSRLFFLYVLSDSDACLGDEPIALMVAGRRGGGRRTRRAARGSDSESESESEQSRSESDLWQSCSAAAFQVSSYHRPEGSP